MTTIECLHYNNYWDCNQYTVGLIMMSFQIFSFQLNQLMHVCLLVTHIITELYVQVVRDKQI